jgi:hypothetical protein
MPWNGPIGGTDYSNCDFTKAPWQSGCMTLTHDEVLFVIENIAPFEEEYGSDTNTIVSKYNNLTGYEKAINGDTYAVIKQYDPTVNTQGIDSNGIIPEPVIEQPTEEAPPQEV